MESHQVLQVLFGWHELEERARHAHLERKLTNRYGALFLKILLLAFLNDARERPHNKRRFVTEIATAFKITPECVNDRLEDLVAIGYLTTKPAGDRKTVVLVATSKARTHLWNYGQALLQAVRAMNDNIETLDPASGAPEHRETDIVMALARLTELEARQGDAVCTAVA